MRTSNVSRGLGRDRLLAAAFVVLVSTAIVGFSAAETGASFTASTTNPGQSWNTATVQPPTAVTATSAAAGAVTLTWTASTTTTTGTQVKTYDVYRGPVGGPYSTLVGSTTASTLTLSDTPSTDGSYGYVVQTRIAQGAGAFTGAAGAVTGTSDRTAPTVGALTALQGAKNAPVTVDFSWPAGTDATSGVAGYVLHWVQAATCPTVANTTNFPNAVSTGNVTSYQLTGTAVKYCAYLQTQDAAGNLSAASNIASAVAR